ncbi:MAG TPA: M18 family aminopeptidase [Acidimicrobiales bacterium]|nr:M18 family aminopeptidase [Acidimicrobiales bacterium]
MTPTVPDLDPARRLLAFCDASPSPYHACATAAALLGEAGFTRLAEDAAWPGEPGRFYLVRGGSLIAWSTGAGHAAHDGFRIVGAHTDSPNLRIKPQPDVVRAGVRQFGVEAYGGVLLNSWLDRDLGLSGRVAVRRNGGGAVVRLLRVDRPVCAIPQLAIHLDRSLATDGLLVDAQHHLTPLWGIEPPAGTHPPAGTTGGDGFVGFVAHELGVAAGDVLGWDLMLHDLAPGALVGRDDELIGSARLDNLASCWAAVEALVDVAPSAREGQVPMVCLFDHEEIGSTSDRGAASSLLPTVVERSVAARGGDREALHRSLARSACLSADMAHATHPNYADRHDPQHPIVLNGGPVLKANANVRYATDAPGSALVALAAEQAGVPLQRFAMRSDLPCGSTIGPVTAARLGITTVDVGMPQLAMHAAREHAGSHDPGRYRALLAAFLAPA